MLDGVRHLNQSIMEEVGRQFGANGVEIDAHMLCAEDHLPYQGQQFTNEEFEDIQDSLDRPFGEWNCRHSWHGIILGVSPPTYTPDQLEKMQRYSTERITVDGRTKTRYQWSQEMRRCETAVRQQKDAANLARATGDDALRRHCQGIILELNKYYEQLADKVGIGPEFQRTYVPGFKDTKVLTSNTVSGTIGTGAQPASLRFVVRSDQFGINASKISPISGYEDVVIHGDKTGFEFRNTDGHASPVNVHELAGMLRESPDYHGGPIRLVACESGAEGATAAQNLADDLGVDVLAPSDVVWIAEDGSMRIGPSWDSNSGHWVLFKPRKE